MTGSDRPRTQEDGTKTATANLVSSLTKTVGGLAEESQCGSIVNARSFPDDLGM